MSNLPFDKTGAAVTNAIAGELLTAAMPADGRYNYLTANQGPFYLDTLVVKLTATTADPAGPYLVGSQRTLTVWKDYIPAFHFIEATAAIGRPIYAGIHLIDKSLVGSVELAYQAIGGAYQIDVAAAAALYAAQTTDSREADYASAFDLSPVFGEVPKASDFVNKVGLSAVMSSMMALQNALAAAPSVYSPIDFRTHINDQNNPHAVDAADLELEKVPNWKTATPYDGAAGTARNLFVTPRAAAAAAGNKNNVPEATLTDEGTVKLNLGIYTGDDTDNVKALTTTGLLNMKRSPTANAVKNTFVAQRQQVFFSPRPIPYPVTCLGKTCINFSELRKAVQDYLKIEDLQASATRECVWLPNDVPVPNLTVVPV